MSEHGYLLLRSVVDPVAVQAARSGVIGSLVELDEVVPLCDDRWTTTAAVVATLCMDSTATAWATSGAASARALRCVVSPMAMSWLRCRRWPEERSAWRRIWSTCDLCVLARARTAYDYPFFSTGLATSSHSRSIHAAWVPLGTVSPQDGALCVVEQSHTSRTCWTRCRRLTLAPLARNRSVARFPRSATCR